MTTPPAKPPAKQEALKPVDEVRQNLNRMEGQFRLALPPHVDPQKFIRVAMTAIQNNAELLNANRHSLFNACMRAAQDGLLPDGREAALVIFKGIVQYMPMVGGILKKLRNSGELDSIHPEVVKHGDKFAYWVDNNGPHLEHKPELFGERGNILGVYCVARTKDGGVYIEAMTHDQVEKVRSVSRAKDNGPWVTWWEEQAKKTVIRRLSKRLPASSDVEKSWEAEDEAVGPVFERSAEAAPPAASQTEQAEKPKKQSRMSRLVASGAPPDAPVASEPEMEAVPIGDAPPQLTDDERLPFEG